MTPSVTSTSTSLLCIQPQQGPGLAQAGVLQHCEKTAEGGSPGRAAADGRVATPGPCEEAHGLEGELVFDGDERINQRVDGRERDG